MKLSTRRDLLFAQLQTVTRAASTRSAVQALSGVHILVQGGSIELRATDMEIGLRVPLEGEVAREGAVVLPARLLVDVIRALPGDEVSLELRPSEQDVEIVAGNATFDIRTLRLEDFPPFPEPESEGRVQLPGKAFVETVAKVARSASRDETRPVLTGILVSASGEDLRMVATDSYRLSVKETQLESALEGSFEANVPARALQELTRIVSQAGTEDVAVVGAHQPGRLRGRRHRALVAADRWPVPQLPPAAARRVRARAASSPPARSPTSCAASRCSRRRTRRCASPSPRAS